jgi:hypothetical protein
MERRAILSEQAVDLAMKVVNGAPCDAQLLFLVPQRLCDVRRRLGLLALAARGFCP